MGKSGKQGDSLKVDANGQLSRDDLKAMYAHWLVVRNEKGDLPAGVRPHLTELIVFPWRFTDMKNRNG